MAKDHAQKFCEKCLRTMRADEFYKSNNLIKYPDGKINQCKKCVTMHVDNWDPETFAWILQECDVPYIPEEWNKLLESYGRDRSKVTGMTIMGRYLSKMQLNQWKKYRWSDTEFLQQLNDHKIEEAMKRQGYSMTDILQVQNINKFVIPEGGFKDPAPFDIQAQIEKQQQQQMEYSAPTPEPQTAQVEDYFAMQSGAEEDDIGNDLTQEEKTYLRLKWGKAYKPEEWVRLEQLYTEMSESYDIQGAGHEDILKLVCKTSLKSNQLLDIGDVEGAQKMVKMYDGLMKSGKFTAAQNKVENGETIDSISEIVEMCEKQGYIERFYIDEPKDMVDLTLKDMQRYTYSLVEGETNLASMIEAAIKQNYKEDKEAEENLETEIVDIDDLDYELMDKDFEEFNNFIEEDEEEDENIEELLEKMRGNT